MPRKTKINQEDIDAFQDAVAGTIPLKQKNTRISPPAKRYIRRKPQTNYAEESPFIFYDNSSTAEVSGEEFITYKQSGVSNKTLRKLRKGQYNVDVRLDLHGMTVDEAKAAVDSLLQQCVRNGLRVALIIHGKGHHSQMPILKNKLNQWLREIDIVLAFCSAAPIHGSRGAMYILVKRSTEEDLV